MAQTHKCGKCEAEFKTEQEYLDHVCEITGVTPADIENLGPEFKAISDAALARGAAKKEASE